MPPLVYGQRKILDELDITDNDYAGIIKGVIFTPPRRVT